MLTQLYSMRTTYKPVFIDPHEIMLSPVDTIEDGRLVKKVNYVKSCVEDNNKQFSVHDFSISSILAVGATNMLNPVFMSNHDIESVSNSVDRIGNSIDAAINKSKSE